MMLSSSWAVVLFTLYLVNDVYAHRTRESMNEGHARRWSSSGSDDASPTARSLTTLSDTNAKWATAHYKARTFLKKFSLQDKVNIVTGVGWMNGRCVGNIPANETLGWPGLCLEDSPLGVRFMDFVTAFPTGINTAATFDRKLMRLRGEAMGKEFRGKGVNVALGPAMNMARAPEGGRLWESFGGDPYLQGEVAYETITGIQEQGVQACAKHFINNEQENFRTTESSNVDDRTQHEIYLHPFLKSVQAGVASVMCSYNLVNNSYACQNDEALNTLLKHQLGFQGYVMSDWAATESTNAANVGLDMSMPGDITLGSGNSYFGANLTDAVTSGNVSMSRIDDMAQRVIAAWYLTGQDKNFPAVNFNAFNRTDEATNEHTNVEGDHYKIVREIGAASTVLLKNLRNTLPLRSPRSISLIGSDAGPPLSGPNGFADRGGTDGTLAMGWGSGTVDFPYLISPLEAIQARARMNKTSVSWWLNDWDTLGAIATSAYTDVSIVFIKSDSGEGYITVSGNLGDRNNLTAWANGDALVQAVAENNDNVVVVVHSAGPLITEPWINHPNVTAVLWAGMPGQESGNSLVDVLFGDINPSGRLPYTIAKRRADYAADIVYNGSYAVGGVQIDYTEGLDIDYRWFDAKNITPRFEFGYGLSHTTFEYSNLVIVHAQSLSSHDSNEKSWENHEATRNNTGASMDSWLHEAAYTVRFCIENTGTVDGWEVPQLYLHAPRSANSPPNNLRGFERVKIPKGETVTVTLQLSRYDLSVWDVVRQGWAKPKGDWGVSIGASSRDFRLSGTIS
ncbi:hypothetical protein FRB94_012540 [Tulasnella sp. JGI-2019a]|nr:hypothetical protein FRB94_012540 [Tulasnella sp. JGI-2019a]